LNGKEKRRSEMANKKKEDTSIKICYVYKYEIDNSIKLVYIKTRQRTELYLHLHCMRQGRRQNNEGNQQ